MSVHPVAAALQDLRVASPCHVSWESMSGDERTRFCGRCRLNVYNLSGMTRDEAERLVRETEGRLCVRFFQRGDGTILTRDCPVGLRSARTRRVRAIVGGLAMSAATLAGSMGIEGCWMMGSVACPSDAANHVEEIPCTECMILHPGLAPCPVCHSAAKEAVELPHDTTGLGRSRRAAVDAAPADEDASRDRLRRALRECMALGPRYAAEYEGAPLPTDPDEAARLWARVKASLRQAILDAEARHSR